MEPLSPQLMHKLVFTVLMHGLNDAQTQMALKILVGALDNPNNQIRELAVVALADLAVPPGKRVAALTVALNDGAARVRRRAARAIGDHGPAAQAALAELIDHLTDLDASVRRDCAGTLGRLGPAAYPAAVDLVAMLADDEGRTRAVVAVALRRIGVAAVPALIDGLRSPEPALRGRCATLLAKIAPDDEHVADLLREVLTDEDAEVRAMADEALQFVTTPPPVRMPPPRIGVTAAI